MHEISISYNRKIELNIWYRKLCLQLQRSDISCSSWPGLRTLYQGFWPTPPYRSSPDLSGFGAVAGQHGVSDPSIDFLLGSGLETGWAIPGSSAHRKTSQCLTEKGFIFTTWTSIFPAVFLWPPVGGETGCVRALSSQLAGLIVVVLLC